MAEDLSGGRPPDRAAASSTPIRICDIGGWTDTHFAKYGAVVNIAIRPGVDVQAHLWEDGRGRRRVHALDYGDSFDLDGDVPARHALLVAAIEEAGLPQGSSLELAVSAQVPPGSSTGTSAAVAVAVIGALDALCGRRRDALGTARRAHRLEVERLGRESGVQDQIASALGGVNHIVIGPYPNAFPSPVVLPLALRFELERRLLLVCLGSPHDSSALHEKVIASLVAEGERSRPLEDLRSASAAARAALEGGDLGAFGAAMVANTDAQARLHPELVGAGAAEVIAMARSHGALGWKVNGAGGDGGSVTVLCGPDARDRAALLAELATLPPPATASPVQLSPDGLRVWDQTLTSGQPARSSAGGIQ